MDPASVLPDAPLLVRGSALGTAVPLNLWNDSTGEGAKTVGLVLSASRNGASLQGANVAAIYAMQEQPWTEDYLNTWHGALAFRTSRSGSVGERLRITSEGKVGIGTTNPGEKLEVNGNVKATKFISQAADGSVLRDVYNEYLALSGGQARRGSTSGGLIQLMGNARATLPGSIQYILGEGSTSPKHLFYNNGSNATIVEIAEIDNSGNLRVKGNIGDLDSGRVAIDSDGYCLYG